MILADFHIHSSFSDGRMTIPEIVDLYGRRGFGAIAITDHLCESSTLLGRASHYLGCSLTPATFPLYLEILKTEAERAREQYDMVLIPGVELTKNSVSNHRSAHILALGIRGPLSADGDAIKICQEIREHGALSVAAHPVWTRLVEKQTYHLWDRRDELSQAFDAWEVASGRVIFEEVEASGFPLLASSDLHHARQIRSWKTIVHSEKHPEAILEAVKQQKVDFRFYDEEVDYDSARSRVTRGVGNLDISALSGNLVCA